MSIRRLLACALVAGCLTGCQAFNDHNEEKDFFASLGQIPPVDGGGSGSVVCTDNANIVVTADPSAAAADSSIGADDAATTVTKLDDVTTMVTVQSAKTTVTFGLKQDKTAVTACNVSIKSGDADVQINSGTILVGMFNKAAADKTLNAGTFVFKAQAAASATKAAAALLGAKADAPKETTVDGSYSADTVAPAPTPEKK